MVQPLANAVVLPFKRLSGKGINEIGNVWCESIFACSCIGEALFFEAQVVSQIINDILSNCLLLHTFTEMHNLFFSKT